MDQLAEHLDKLPLFLETVRAGSIRQAAKTLGRSQPAVSRAIRLLEDAVGERLFVRDHDGVKLTPTGQRLFELADLMRSEIEQFRASSAGEERIRQKVCFGTYESIAVYFFPGFLKYAADVQEELEISLFTARSPALMDALQRSQVDIIMSVNPPDKRNVHSELLYADEYRVYQHPDLVLTNKTPLLTFPEATDAKGRSIAQYLASSPHKRRRRFVCQSFELVTALTVAGLGLGILPARAAQKALARGELVEEAPSARAPWRFGRHEICVSFLRHRLGDSGITWIHRTLERFEASKLL